MYENLKNTANQIADNLFSSIGTFNSGVNTFLAENIKSLLPLNNNSSIKPNVLGITPTNNDWTSYHNSNFPELNTTKLEVPKTNTSIQNNTNINAPKIYTPVTTSTKKTVLKNTPTKTPAQQRKIDIMTKRDLDGNGSISGSEFMQSGAGQAVNIAANLIGSTVNALGNSVGNYANRNDAQKLDETQEAARNGIYSAVSMIPGWGPLISAGLQLTDGIGKLAGTQMSNISKDAAEDAGLNRGFNNVVATIPGLGSLLGGFTKKTNEFNIDWDRFSNINSAYDMSTFNSAEDLSEGKFLGQRNKVNNFISEQNLKRDKLTSISDNAKLRKLGASTAAADLVQQNRNRYSGNSGNQTFIGKDGLKIPNIEWARNLLKINKFQKGGKLGIDMNVIVEGSYHVHNNHLDKVNPELQEVTPKGIPVTITDESGNKQQVAEIERKELILTKDLTNKLENLYKDGSDEAAIKAGILFAEELFNNTKDNTGEVLNESN